MTEATYRGWLEVICGPMFAGKSSHLLERHRTLTQQGLRVHAFKPARDTRYSAQQIMTHDGAALDATAISAAADITASPPSPPSPPSAPVILIDEAHFFGNALIAPVMQLVHDGRRVIVAGVDKDHRGEPFAPFPHLLIEADSVTKLHARCHQCGAPAIHSQRMIDDDSPIVVGGADLYEARCRKCFVPMRALKSEL
ncbi:MAG: thymidine kinase [Planctomycetota bacterium]|nr:thymidine kinase [Planctomycetota bacterium]